MYVCAVVVVFRSYPLYFEFRFKNEEYIFEYVGFGTAGVAVDHGSAGLREQQFNLETLGSVHFEFRFKNEEYIFECVGSGTAVDWGSAGLREQLFNLPTSGLREQLFKDAY